MNYDERLMLQKMIKANDVEDQTELIRKLKHSHLLEKDINRLLQLKQEDTTSDEEMMTECSFLFSQYTDIYNKVKKNEINLNILNRFLNVLRNIEDGEIDQHEGSFIVGSLLKELYVDSALRKAEKLNAHKNGEQQYMEPIFEKLTYKEYRQKMATENL